MTERKPNKTNPSLEGNNQIMEVKGVN